MFDLNFPRAYGQPTVRAVFKQQAEDFFVEEQLGFEPAGTGEHVYLFIEKRHLNTRQLVDMLARSAGLKRQDVSYAGLKDRHALTRQWFSLYLPKGDFVATGLPDNIRVIQCSRHSKKLRTGDHQGNFFRIRLRDVQGQPGDVEQRLQRIAQQGVPNYFGQQRFGHHASNLEGVEAFLQNAKGKQKHFHDRMRVSAMRSWLFNAVLAQRVRDGSWQQCLDGEPGSQPSGPLWGRGRLPSHGVCVQLEQQVLTPYQSWCDFLEHCGLQQDRRPLQLIPQNLVHRWHGEQELEVSFDLPNGAFATVLLRELAELEQGASTHAVVAHASAVNDPVVNGPVVHEPVA